MNSNDRKLIRKKRLLYAASDFAATSLAWVIFNYLRFIQLTESTISHPHTFEAFYHYKQVLLGQIFFPIMMMGLYWMSGYYNRPLFKSRLDELLTTLTTSVIGSVLIYFIAIFDDPIPDKASNIELFIMLIGLLFGIVYIARFTITSLGIRSVKRGKISVPLVVIGVNSNARRLRRNVEKMAGSGQKIKAYVVPTPAELPKEERYDGLPVIPINELASFVAANDIRGLLIPEDINIGEKGSFSALLNLLYPLEIPILVSPSTLQMTGGVRKLGDVAGEPLLDICSARMSDSTNNLKRTGDVVVSALAILLLSPLFALLAILVKLDSRGPVFFRQERIGYHKKRFNIVKFRTMHTDAEAAGPALSSEGDIRVTRIGRTLRKYRLDEIPQFWNVLIGDMSLVGPRPEREFYISRILKTAPYFTLLHQVRPGITSWGMVKHGYASTVDEMVERSRFDLLYLENISLIVDLKILLYTVRTVISGRGV